MARKDAQDRGLFERPLGIWWIQYSDSEGRRRREKVGLKRAALALYTRRKREAREGIQAPTRKVLPMPLSEILSDAVARSKSRKGEKSWKQDEAKAEVFKRALGSRSADSLSPQEIERWLDTYKDEKNLTGATINRYRAFLSKAYTIAQNSRKVSINPVHHTEHHKESAGRVRWLRDEEETRLLEVITPEQQIEILFAAHTGVRQGRQFDLKWSQVDLERGVVYFPSTKNGLPQWISLNSRLRGLLAQLPNSGPYVFPESRSTLLANKRLNWFNNALKAAGIEDFHWHDLRHTFASRLAMQGHDMRTLQTALHHRSPQMTMRYAHLSDDHMRDALEGLVK